MTATVDQGVAAREPPKYRTAYRIARPVLGLVLPVGLALFWEIAVHLGLSNGRLVPPPSVPPELPPPPVPTTLQRPSPRRASGSEMTWTCEGPG